MVRQVKINKENTKEAQLKELETLENETYEDVEAIKRERETESLKWIQLFIFRLSLMIEKKEMHF